jgi:hypothetical protein
MEETSCRKGRQGKKEGKELKKDWNKRKEDKECKEEEKGMKGRRNERMKGKKEDQGRKEDEKRRVIRRKEVIGYTEEGKAKGKEVNGRNGSKARGMEYSVGPPWQSCVRDNAHIQQTKPQEALIIILITLPILIVKMLSCGATFKQKTKSFIL